MTVSPTTAPVAGAAHATELDPVTTEIIRHGLEGAAEQMRVALCRMAFSPVIYEMIDFGAGLYDREARLLAQARALPAFLGTLGFCIEAAVRQVGGAEALQPGDVIVSNYAYDTGSHQPDLTVIVPGFLDGELAGYAAVKAHLADVGAKDFACTDTTDNFQEGLILPHVHLYRRGERQEDVYRILLANSRMPQAVAGDVAAMIATAKLGLDGLFRLVERHGAETFRRSVEAMFDHGEAVVRRLFERIPDGRYVGHAQMDNDGITDDPVPFTVAVEVSGSDVAFDFTQAPPAQRGPINCPRPMTVSASRIAIMSIAGGAESCNEGFFRPLDVRTARGTMFEPQPPAPVYLYGWPVIAAIDAIHRALAAGLPDRVPAGNGGDNCAMAFWGQAEDGSFWVAGMNHSIGQGASAAGDGRGPLMHISTSGVRFGSVEALESRGHLAVERCELSPDSAGAGRHRGGLGLDMTYRTLDDCQLTAPWEQTLTPAWGVHGGGEGRPGRWRLQLPDGSVVDRGKLGAFPLPAGSVLELSTGAGGGWGSPAERDPAAVHADVTAGYVSDEQARRSYPHAFVEAETA